MITERISFEDDPDGISEFLSQEFGIDWAAAAQAVDGAPETSTSAEPDADDPDGIADFLGAEYNLDWAAIENMDFSTIGDEPSGNSPVVTETQAVAVENATLTTETTGDDSNDYSRDNEIPVIAGDAMYEALKTANLPAIRSLELSPEAARFLDTPITDAKGIGVMRRYVQGILESLRDELHLNDDIIFNARLGISEALQNALRYGAGVHRVILGATPYNNVFIGVENLAIDNAGDFHNFRCVSNAAAVGNAAIGLGVAPDEVVANEHSRGLFLMAVHTVNGLQTEEYTGLQRNRTVSAGLCSLPVDALDKLSHGQALTSDDTRPDGELLRTISWGVYGYDTEAARQADAAMAAAA